MSYMTQFVLALVCYQLKGYTHVPMIIVSDFPLLCYIKKIKGRRPKAHHERRQSGAFGLSGVCFLMMINIYDNKLAIY